MGDSGLLTFELSQLGAENVNPLNVAKAALEMQKEFNKIREGWENLGWPVERVYSRIGIESGYIKQEIVGHPSKREIAVFGDAVNVASILCRAADRTKDAIYIGEKFYEQISKYKFIDVAEIAIEKRKREKDLITKPYELRDIKEW